MSAINLAITPERWMQGADCTQVDPDMFFAPSGDAASHRAARAICRGCDVAAQCAEFALRTGQQHGVWAGKSVTQLRKANR